MTLDRHIRTLLPALLALGCAPALAAPPPAAASAPARVDAPGASSWQDDLLAARSALAQGAPAPALKRAAIERAWREFSARHPIEADWLLQDGGPEIRHVLLAGDPSAALRAALARALALTPPTAQPDPRAGLRPVLDAYARACERRRVTRLRALARLAPRVVFTKRHTVRPSFFAYTEGQSDAQAERHFRPGSELCLLTLDDAGTRARVTTLLADPDGVIRDPTVSWEGDRILFAWKRALDTDDYHLHDLEVATGAIRQLTHGLGAADYEPAYLPGGDIVFASTRCVQTVDCFWTESSNLYTCDRDGRHIRRLGFDQVHAIHPTVLDDGRVIYTRWDYNDRGQIFPQGLFQMNPDGTGQAEFYGNNSWFPTTIAHARGIPGTGTVLAVFCGHHTSQAGKLGLIDRSRGLQEDAGARLVAPTRDTPPERIDAYGQSGELFQYPYPLNAREFLVSYAPLGWEPGARHSADADFSIYWMNIDGHRELLAADPLLPCQQPVPLTRRTRPPVRPASSVAPDARATCHVQDVHAGDAMRGVERGLARRIRVVALEFRAAGIGHNYSRGPAGEALSSTPVSIGNGAWDVKTVLGTAPIEPDGSAHFTVPARTPLYFQLLDERGRVIQTMRSWTTLQPGEHQSCVGCHEPKHCAPPVPRTGPTRALRKQAATLAPFSIPPRGFSFPREVQPILDRHCVGCHNDRSRPYPALRTLSPAGAPRPRPGAAAAAEPVAFSLLGVTSIDPGAKRYWSDSYLALVGARPHDNPRRNGALIADNTASLVNWIGAQSPPDPLPPLFAGSIRSALLPMLERGHGGTALSRAELETLACWIDLGVPYCGDYTEANAWTAEERARYTRFEEKRQRFAGDGG